MKHPLLGRSAPLRESLISALETLLQRGKREALPESNANEIEAKLRHISGEIGEQRTRLDQAFLELGERPEAILSELAEMVAARIFSGASSELIHPLWWSGRTT